MDDDTTTEIPRERPPGAMPVLITPAAQARMREAGWIPGELSPLEWLIRRAERADVLERHAAGLEQIVAGAVKEAVRRDLGRARS